MIYHSYTGIYAGGVMPAYGKQTLLKIIVLRILIVTALENCDMQMQSRKSKIGPNTACALHGEHLIENSLTKSYHAKISKFKVRS